MSLLVKIHHKLSNSKTSADVGRKCRQSSDRVHTSTAASDRRPM